MIAQSPWNKLVVHQNDKYQEYCMAADISVLNNS